MRSYTDKFPSRYLKADDLKGRRLLVTLDRVVDELIGQGRDAEDKAVVYFKEESNGLVLNKTNAASIAEITSTDDMDDWPGHRVVLYPTKTEMSGKRVPCIRIDEPPTAAAPPERVSADTQVFADELGLDDEVH
jgi:hypothetical protein